MTQNNEAYREWRHESNKYYFETAPTDYEDDDYQPLDETGAVPDSWTEDEWTFDADLDAELPF